jgi:hypothetical protein
LAATLPPGAKDQANSDRRIRQLISRLKEDYIIVAEHDYPTVRQG